MNTIKMALIVTCLLLTTNVVMAEELSSTDKEEIQAYFQSHPELTPAEKRAYIEGYTQANTAEEEQAKEEEKSSKEEAVMKQYQHNQRTDNRNQRQFNRTSRHVKKDYHDSHESSSSNSSSEE